MNIADFGFLKIRNLTRLINLVLVINGYDVQEFGLGVSVYLLQTD